MPHLWGLEIEAYSGGLLTEILCFTDVTINGFEGARLLKIMEQ